MSILTDADSKFLPWALRPNRGFHLATEWYLNGWKPLPYQWAWHHLDVVNTTFIAGIASGKTRGAAASFLMDCISIPYFRALNTSVTAKQAELVFDMVMEWIEGNPKLEHLVDNISLRPFPSISFKNFAAWEFRTAGMDARFIRGSEYDRVNFDEAGLDPYGEIAKVLRGRLRGTRPDGSTRMARMDVITSPTDAEWLRERFARGDKSHPEAMLEQYRSLRVATWDNTMLTDAQVEAMKAEYPPEMIDVEMGGMFPDYGVSMFPSGHVNACIDQSLYDAAYLALNPEDGKAKEGYVVDEDPRHGIIHWEMPREPGHIYVMGGDPGMDNYPKRNAACVMVADVTRREAKKLVYFKWVSGRGSYNPFLQSFKYAIHKYDPVLRGIDATGTQRGLDEIAFENAGIHTDRLNFSSDKTAMLNELSMDITNHRWIFPPIKGLKRQLGTYNLSEDKKLAQDLVMTLAELSFLDKFVPAEPVANSAAIRHNYRDRRQRTTASRRRR